MLWFRLFARTAAVLAFAGCATGGPPSTDLIHSTAQSAASAIATEWGVPPGAPRESKLRGWLVALYSDPNVAAAAKEKGWRVDWTTWGETLSSEGLVMLPDGTLRRYLEAKERILVQATDAECAAFAATHLGKGSYADTLIWRQRLSRVSEEDFDTLQQTELAAFAERAKRRAETVPSLSETQVAAALKALYGGITRRLDLTAVGATVTALSRVQDNPSAASPADMCAFIRMMVIGVNAEVNLTHFTAVSPK